jgi:ABC-type branched-subunit amino acid transport system ATPase component
MRDEGNRPLTTRQALAVQRSGGLSTGGARPMIDGRLAIARALLKGPKVLIFEPPAHWMPKPQRALRPR